MTAKGAPLAAYLETAPGLEEVAWLEVRQRFPHAQFSQFLFARDERGIAAFDVAAAPSELLALRTAESIFLTGSLLPKTTRGYRDLRQLREQMVGSGDFGRAVNAFSRYRRRQVRSYRLIVRTYGKHEYDRQAVRRAVLQALEHLYPEWQRVQEDPDLELWANVLGSSILIGLRLPLPAARQASLLPGILPSSVAEALVLLSEPQADDRFLDPFFDGGAVIAARSAYPARLLLGGAPSQAELAGVQPTGRAVSPPALATWHGAHLPLPAHAVNKVATRFPVAPAADVTARYATWLSELQRVLQPGSNAVVLTRAFEQFKSAIREAPHLEIRGGYSVTVSGEWGRIYLLLRKAEG
ncbi:MAG TPA: hypothetical protein VE553_08275 [Candidatus Binatia bacterium]|nr:hypothetical protein [Candidatus Binatia bacterium]